MGRAEGSQEAWREAEARGRVLAALRSVLARYGFRPASLSVLTPLEDVQAGGEKFRRRVAQVQTPLGGARMLRPKLSLSALALFRDRLRNDTRPVRLAVEGPVFQVEEDEREVRESDVAGAVIVGSASRAAVAELLALSRDLFDALGLGGYDLSLGHRGVAGAVLARLDFDPRLRQLVEDRLGALGAAGAEDALRELLARFEAEESEEAPQTDDRDDFQRVVEKMSPEDLEIVLRGMVASLDLPPVQRRDYGEMVGRLLRRTTLKAQAPNVRRAIEDLRRTVVLRGAVADVVRDARTALGEAASGPLGELVAVSETAVRDLRITRVGADLGVAAESSFYDGLYFRVRAGGATLGHGGVMAGLLEAMGMGEPTPSASVAFDVARLAELLPASDAPAPRALVAPVAAADLPAALELSRALRAEGASVEMDVMERTIKQNLAYAVKRGFAYLVIIGEEERLKNRAAVRDLEKKAQRDFALDDPAALARFLGGAS